MQLSDTQTKVAAVIGALLVIGLIYFIWTRSVVPEPTIPPGQSLANPLGEARGNTPGGPARAGGPSASPGMVAPNGGAPVNVPAPGTVDPQRGFGPSKGAPIPHTQ